MKVVSSRISVVQRSKGKSLLAAAAYDLRLKLRDETTGETFYFRPRTKEEVRYRRIFLCDSAPKEFEAPEVLWNDLIKHENKSSKAGTAQLARRIRFCLPQGLTEAEEIAIVEKFAETLTAQGMIVQAVIHDKQDGNPHVHFLVTMRPYKNGRWQPKTRKVYDLDAFGNRIPVIDKRTGHQKTDKKGRRQWKNHKEHLTDWDAKDQPKIWRAQWAAICNAALSFDQKITEKSYREQGLDNIPMKHEGYKARQIENAGGKSEICEFNRIVRKANETIDQLQQETYAAALQALNDMAEADRNQEKINDQVRNIAARFIDGDGAGKGFTSIGRDDGGVLSLAFRKLKAAFHTLRMGTNKLLRVIGLARGSGDRDETDRKELRTALDDAGSRDAVIGAKLNERAAMGRPGREKQRDRRGAR